LLKWFHIDFDIEITIKPYGKCYLLTLVSILANMEVVRSMAEAKV